MPSGHCKRLITIVSQYSDRTENFSGIHAGHCCHPAAMVVPLQLPVAITPTWVAGVATALDAATRLPPGELQKLLPFEVCVQLLERCQRLLQAEPTLLQVRNRVAPAPGRLLWDGTAAARPRRRRRVDDRAWARSQHPLPWGMAEGADGALLLYNGCLFQRSLQPAYPPVRPLCMQVTPPEGADGRVVVVGDTHGQYHDVCRM